MTSDPEKSNANSRRVQNIVFDLVRGNATPEEKEEFNEITKKYIEPVLNEISKVAGSLYSKLKKDGADYQLTKIETEAKAYELNKLIAEAETERIDLASQNTVNMEEVKFKHEEVMRDLENVNFEAKITRLAGLAKDKDLPEEVSKRAVSLLMKMLNAEGVGVRADTIKQSDLPKLSDNESN